jgi:hypothetical protein
VIEPDLDDKRRTPQPRELRRLHFDGMRVLLGRGEALDVHTVATHRLDQRLEIGGSRYNPGSFLREDRLWRRRGKRGERHDQGSDQDFSRVVKTDFGIMQCTPLRMSTTCVTRQSPTIETRP